MSLKDELTSVIEKVKDKKKKICILTHTNPDPDAIASAYGLWYFFKETAGIEATIYYDGIIGRINNRIMVDLLDIPIKKARKDYLKKFDYFCLVDTQPGKKNNCLPTYKKVLIVIDHHFEEGAENKGDLIDIRENVGSTAAIVCQYLEEFEIEVPENLATALFYGIKTDTDGLLRDYSSLDEKYYKKLFLNVDYKKLHKIEYPELPKEYFFDFADAITSARIFKDILIADLGEAFVPDMTGEMADYFLRMEGVSLVLVYGVFKDMLYFSIRTKKRGKTLGKVSYELAEGIGSGGGHNKTGGGVVQHPEKNKDIFLDRFYKKFSIEKEKLTTFYTGMK
ncbi:phosphoesterase RecJ domain-containing protein [Thermotomaculum hydrothermale]|uniref:Phosphoesterase RecJ domain-containing protein n=1 Tax=Thermotomaculum hydrothermale TaxID=981385 RepID=A0A7R6PX38_9BACT|nr:DHH family phosphoesterase [Thermotomaculum hydrothermale]BBB32270.1 phosphoesterase RecJ domain-containing protein [Thermotomaculum hydrothermale]